MKWQRPAAMLIAFAIGLALLGLAALLISMAIKLLTGNGC